MFSILATTVTISPGLYFARPTIDCPFAYPCFLSFTHFLCVCLCVQLCVPHSVCVCISSSPVSVSQPDCLRTLPGCNSSAFLSITGLTLALNLPFAHLRASDYLVDLSLLLIFSSICSRSVVMARRGFEGVELCIGLWPWIWIWTYSDHGFFLDCPSCECDLCLLVCSVHLGGRMAVTLPGAAIWFIHHLHHFVYTITCLFICSVILSRLHLLLVFIINPQ